MLCHLMVPYSLHFRTSPHAWSHQHPQPAPQCRVHYRVYVLNQAVQILILIQKVQVTSPQCQIGLQCQPLAADSYAPDSQLVTIKHS